MPELPDLEAYVAALRPRVLEQPLDGVQVLSPHLLRTVEPEPEAAEGIRVRSIERLGKRVVIGFANDVHFIIHLMIAGRFLWQARAPGRPSRITVARFRFPAGTLTMTEAGSKKRSSLHVVGGADDLAPHHPGGIEVLDTDLATFRTRLRCENHTLKRALTDQRLFSGIGNAYSDEILHAARLSPVRLTKRLTDDEIGRLFEATRKTLSDWTRELVRRFASRFPGRGDVTAFRDGFAVHGRFGKPCPACATTIQRIRYADRETNYCPKCQTKGRVLADRSLSRLLKRDWPGHMETADT